MKLHATRISDVKLLVPRIFSDERGYFVETWNQRALQESGFEQKFVQDNLSYSRQWVLRGLHYQISQPQGKLVRVIQGTVFDVAVDLRRSSSTFGQWVGYELSGENAHALWIPPGFAHGFVVLSADAYFAYKCTDFYAAEHERTILWNDPEIGIAWPLPGGVTPVVSSRDQAGESFTAAQVFD